MSPATRQSLSGVVDRLNELVKATGDDIEDIDGGTIGEHLASIAGEIEAALEGEPFDADYFAEDFEDELNLAIGALRETRKCGHDSDYPTCGDPACRALFSLREAGVA